MILRELEHSLEKAMCSKNIEPDVFVSPPSPMRSFQVPPPISINHREPPALPPRPNRSQSDPYFHNNFHEKSINYQQKSVNFNLLDNSSLSDEEESEIF